MLVSGIAEDMMTFGMLDEFESLIRNNGIIQLRIHCSISVL
jgi:hypothetical protein